MSTSDALIVLLVFAVLGMCSYIESIMFDPRTPHRGLRFIGVSVAVFVVGAVLARLMLGVA